MSFVGVYRTGELGFLADSFCEDHDLLEEEDCHLLELEVGGRGGVVSALQGTTEQQLTLGNYLTLKIQISQ